MDCASSMLLFRRGRSLVHWAGIFPMASMSLTYVSASDSFRYHCHETRILNINAVLVEKHDISYITAKQKRQKPG